MNSKNTFLRLNICFEFSIPKQIKIDKRYILSKKKKGVRNAHVFCYRLFSVLLLELLKIDLWVSLEPESQIFLDSGLAKGLVLVRSRV